MLPAARQHAVPPRAHSRRDRCGAIAAARTPAALALGLQRTAGNRAVANAVAPRMRILREHKREPALEPGTGYDGIQQHYGEVVSQKNLNEAQKQAAREFRSWMEDTFDAKAGYKKGSWAREAGARAARFPGDAAARANLYAEFQRQIIQAGGGARSDWVAMAERGADGSYIFRGNTGIAEPKMFVVDPQGNCYAGNQKEGLSGRGRGKTVNYDKLTKIGTVTPPTGGAGGTGGTGGATAPKTEPAKPGTGGEPTKTPKTGEPVGGGPKVEPVGGGKAPTSGGPKVEPTTGGKPTTGGGARMGSGSASEGGKMPRFSLRGVGGFIALTALFWWLGSRGDEAEAKSLDKIMSDKVEPKAQEAFKAKAAEAERVNREAPWFEQHAIITADFDYTWDSLGIGGTPTREHVYDARFVSLELGGKLKDSKTTVLRHDKHTPLFSGDTVHDATRRVTWSVALNFDESPEHRRYRSHQIHANQAIQKGWSARKAAEGQHFERGSEVLSRKDLENQKFGLPTEADVREMLDREAFVRAYIEMIQYYDADELLRDARAYLAELEAQRTRDPYAPRFKKKTAAPLVPL
jgi:hypothetical protein